MHVSLQRFRLHAVPAVPSICCSCKSMLHPIFLSLTLPPYSSLHPPVLLLTSAKLRRHTLVCVHTWRPIRRMFGESSCSFHTVSGGRSHSKTGRSLIGKGPHQLTHKIRERSSEVKGSRERPQAARREDTQQHVEGVGTAILTSTSLRGNKRETKATEGYEPPHYVGLPKYWLPNETFHPVINPRSRHIYRWLDYACTNERYHALCELVKGLWFANVSTLGSEMNIKGVNNALQQLGIMAGTPLAEKILAELALDEAGGNRFVGYSLFKSVFVAMLQSLLQRPQHTEGLHGGEAGDRGANGDEIGDNNPDHTSCGQYPKVNPEGTSVETLREQDGLRPGLRGEAMPSALTSCSVPNVFANEPSVGWPGVSDICSTVTDGDLPGAVPLGVKPNTSSGGYASPQGPSSVGVVEPQVTVQHGIQGIHLVLSKPRGKENGMTTARTGISALNACIGGSCPPSGCSRHPSSRVSTSTADTCPDGAEEGKTQRARMGSSASACDSASNRASKKSNLSKRVTRMGINVGSRAPLPPSWNGSVSGVESNEVVCSARGKISQTCEGPGDSDVILQAVEGGDGDNEGRSGLCEAAGVRSHYSRAMARHRRRVGSAPVLCVSVVLPGGERGIIDVYRGDTVEELVSGFSTAYKLNEKLRRRLSRLLKRKFDDFKWKL